MKTPKISLTKRQDDIYNFIKSYISEKKIPPTIKEICREFGFSSTNAAYEALKVLEKKGYLTRSEKGLSRGIVINEEDEKAGTKDELPDFIRQLNIVGVGDSGNPISLFVNTRGSINADVNFFRLEGENYFAHVAEDSGMGKEGILEGDVVIVSQGRSVESGQIVAALIKDKVYVRRIEKYSDGDELIASARGFQKFKMKKNDKSVTILGIAVGLMKRF
ncbi:transcriptional repressor LexA [Bacteroidota bacterium]